MKINLFTQKIQGKEKERQSEYDYCLDRNSKNKSIDNFVVITKSGNMSYSDFFQLTKAYPDDVNILANSDIYFDDSINLCRNIAEKQIYALSRWNPDIDGVCLDHNDPQKRGLTRSQDVWVCKGEVKDVYGDIPLGFDGCDNRIAHEFTACGYLVTNPCMDIKCYHKHKSRKKEGGRG